jgi:ATP-binding cassette subfamily F protein 3
LILDEPTNHLDLQSKKILKEALQQYEGTLLVVSHDRDFLNGLTNIVYEIQPDGLRTWFGDVLDFLKEKKAESIALFEQNKVSKAEKPKVQVVEVSREDHRDKKEKERIKKKLQTQIEKLEKGISLAEETIRHLDGEIALLDYNNAENSQKKLAEYEEAKKQLEDLMAEWEKTGAEMSEL